MSGTPRTSLTNQVNRLQQNTSATALDQSSMRPGGATTRVRPQSMSEPHLRGATSLTTLLQPAPNTAPKRVALVQAEVASLEPSAFGDSTQEMLEHKVQAVFEQIELVLDQRLVDDRKGTTQVFTLPEFFWNDFGTNVTPTDREGVLHMIAERAADPKFNHAVFVLGTIMTSHPPAMLAGLDQGNLDAISRGLGESPQNITEAHTEAHDPRNENFKTRAGKHRVNLAASVAIAHELSGGSPSNVHFERAGAAVNQLRAHESAYMLLAGFANRDTLTQPNLDALRNANSAEDKRAALENLCPNAPEHAATLVDDLQAMITDAPTSSKFTRRLDLFTEHFLPFKLTRLKMENNQVEPDMIAAHQGLQLLEASPTYNMPEAIEKGGAMYKQLTNEAIVMQGGSETTGPHTIRKFAPSDIDVPSYNRARGRKEGPPFAHKFQQQPGGLNPSVSELRMQQRLQQSDYHPHQQVTFSGERDLSMSTVVCRDIDTAMFRETVSSEVNETDLFLLISAGIKTRVFEQNAPNNDIVAQNDGHFKQADVRHGHMQRPVPSQVFLQSDRGESFDLVPATDRTRFAPGGPGRVRISSPLHLKGAPGSSEGSWQPEAPFERNRLESEVKTYTSELTFLNGLEDAFGRATADVMSRPNADVLQDLTRFGVKFTPDQATRFLAEPRAVIQELRGIVASDIRSAEQLLQSAANRLASLPKPTD